MIHTSIDFDYLNLFKKNYKSMGKIKFIKWFILLEFFFV
jgi:hypothetical protein